MTGTLSRPHLDADQLFDDVDGFATIPDQIDCGWPYLDFTFDDNLAGREYTARATFDLEAGRFIDAITYTAANPNEMFDELDKGEAPPERLTLKVNAFKTEFSEYATAWVTGTAAAVLASGPKGGVKTSAITPRKPSGGGMKM